MKFINKLFILSVAAILFSSCLKDLDTLPLNTTDFTSENAYANEDSYLKALAYINGYYMLVGMMQVTMTSDSQIPDSLSS